MNPRIYASSLALALICAGSVRGDYAVLDLGIRGDFQTSAAAMNARGMVVGVSGVGMTSAFLFDGQSTQSIPNGNASTSDLLAINDAGQAVGVSLGRNTGRPYVSAYGLPAPSTGANAAATGLNNAGEIVGYDTPTPGGGTRPFVAIPDASAPGGYAIANPTDVAGRALLGSAVAVNASGLVAGTADIAGGTAAFLWSPGGSAHLLDFSTSPWFARFDTAATAINASGVVAGTSDDPNHPGFLLDHNTGAVTLLPFAPASINASGEVVGGTFLYNQGVTTDLSGFDLGHNFRVLSLAAIDDSGQILVNAVDRTDTIDGVNPTYGVFVLTPTQSMTPSPNAAAAVVAVPEPGGLALLAIGGLGMLAVGRRAGRGRRTAEALPIRRDFACHDPR